MNKLLPLCASLALAASPAFAGFQAHRISAPEAVVMDGKLDEGVWLKAPVHDTFFENAPQDKIPAKVRTEVRVAYDDKNIYFGIKAFEAHPDDIRAPFVRRDKVGGDHDFIGLWIDPSGANKSAQIVYLNARGAFTDGVFSNSNGEDESPDFDVEVVTGRFEGGWTAEVRIPFNQIAYVAGQSTPWHLLVMRNLTRDQRYKNFSGQVTQASNCLLCFSEPIEGLQAPANGLNWTATPQVVLRRQSERVDGQSRTSSHDTALSLDMKIRPDSATTIDATINPDFSQIELDAPQLSGNTRFGLFVPEKRPFFLEGSDIYQTPFRAINTRSMTDPGWGVRYTRREATRDMTFMSVRDAGGGLVMLPKSYNTDFASQDFSSQATVGRVNFKQGKLAVGGILSDRTLIDSHAYNRVIGPDFSYQFSDSSRMSGQLLMSATTAQPNASNVIVEGARSTGTAAFTDYSWENDKWAIYGQLEEVSKGFRDDNGFFSQAGEKMAAVEYTWKFGKNGMWNRMNFYAHLERKVDADGKIIYNDYTPGLWMEGPLDTQINLRVRPFNATRVAADGELFKKRTIWGAINSTPSRLFSRLSAELELGDEIDVEGARRGKGGTLGLYARLRPHDRFEVETNFNSSWIDGRSGPEDGHRLYTEKALQVNATYHFGARDNVRMILQKSKMSRDPSYYKQVVAPESTGNTTSIVYNHTAGLGKAAYVGLTLSDGETPGFDPRRRQNELFVKLSWQI